MLDSLLPDEVLALTIYGEARGETVDGQIAVANVIINRWKSNPIKYKTVKEVCIEPHQFSCWNESDVNYPLLIQQSKRLVANQSIDTILKQCLYISRGALGFNIIDNTKGAKNYMTTSLLKSDGRPKWADNRKGEVVIGNHTFFNV